MIVAPSFDILGGQSTQAAVLCSQLRAESAVEVTFHPTNPRLPGPLRRLQGIRYVRTVCTCLLYVAHLLRSVRRQDVIHIFSAAHSSFAISATPAILVARAFRKATVLHYHSGEADRHLRTWRRSAPRTMRLVDAIVVPSRYLVRQFARNGLRARLILNVVEPEHIPFRERRPLAPTFLCNRQLEPYCGVDGVLRAFALVQAEINEASLVVAADGPQRRDLERLAVQLSLRNTRFVGWVHPELIGALYASADVFLNCSDDRDNVPMSFLEAFCSGALVVSTDVAGISELVRSGENGILVPPGDHRGLADSALALLADPERANAMARRARESCEPFTWPAIREQWLDLYATLADRPEPS